jgi:SAM-dependent MidA family methyltransferase
VIEDVVDAPGSTDITAGVDFAAITGRAEKRGLSTFPSATQHDILRTLGFEAWARTELDRQTALLGSNDGLGAVRAWSGRSRATLLVDPAALGRLRWLLLASSGLPQPSWLA